MTVFRLRHTSVAGFPRCGSISACHALRPIPPSSNPACGFPALGFPGNSRHGHTQGVARFARSQVHQPQILKVVVHRPPLLGFQAQFLSQSRELLRQLDTLSQSGRWAFGGQFFRSGTIVQAGLLPYRQKHVSGQAPWLHEHYPVSQLLWACPTPDQGRPRVISSPKALWLGPHPAGPPRFLDQSVSTRRPLSPRRARQLHTSVSSLPALGFTYPGRMATPIKFNEAESGSLALRLAPSPHEASPDRVTPSRARSATCQTGNFQGELLSAHKIGQASPGAPGLTRLIGFFCSSLSRRK